MISLDNVSLTVGKVSALSGFSGAFAPGTITALVGGDGAGKTTLLRALAVPSRRITLGIRGIDSKAIGYQPETSGVWANLSVEENLDFTAEVYGLDKQHIQSRINELLVLAQLDGAANRLGRQLSGGMRQKLGVMMAMLHQPALLLLDEPTTGVDKDSRQQLWALLHQAKQEGAIIILATTYLDEAQAADQVFLLDGGRVVAAGSPDEVIAQTPGVIWQEPAQEHSPLPINDDHTWQRGHTVFHWQHNSDGEHLNASQPVDTDLELAAMASLLAHRDNRDGQLDFEAIPLPSLPKGKQLILGRQIVHQFGSFKALDGVNIEVDSGEIVGLIGGNGAGKSTLIRVLLGLAVPTSGNVSLFGAPPDHRARAQIGYVPQGLGLYGALTPIENLAFTMGIFGQPVSRDLLALSQSVGSGSTSRLSLGAQRNLAAICAMSHHPKLLILDEPTSGMDVISRARLWKLLRKAANHGMGILITTHYQQEARQCDRLIHLHQGKVVRG